MNGSLTRLRKDKIGFATPEYHWLNEKKDEFRTYMTHAMGEFLDVERMGRDWDGLLERQSQNGITTLWRFINLGIWRKVYAL